MVLNAQVTQENGIVQLLGKHNQDAAKALDTERAQAVVDAFIDAGVPVGTHAWGLQGLKVPQPV